MTACGFGRRGNPSCGAEAAAARVRVPRRDAAQKPFDQRQTSRVWHRLSTLSVTEQGSQTLFHEFNSSDILEDLSGKEYKTQIIYLHRP